MRRMRSSSSKRMRSLSKTVVLFICIGAILLSLNVSTLKVLADADGTVTYEGSAGDFIFEPGTEYSPTDLFPDFKNVMPGDHLTEQIQIVNKASKEVKVKIYMRSFGWTDKSEKWLEELSLTVDQEGDSILFQAAPDESAQLTDWVCLGTFYSGASVILNVTLDVPVTIGNEYQSVIGCLDWQFMVEEYPIEESDPDLPDTGDDSHPGLWIALGAGSVAAAGILLVIWNKKRKE